MKLADLLAAERVVDGLPGETLADAATALVGRLSAAGLLLNEDRLRERIAEDRAEDVVTLDGRAFVLHYRTDAVAGVHVALGRASRPLRRSAAPDEPQQAPVVLMLVAPPREAARYLQVLRGFSRLLSRDETVSDLLGRPDAAAIVGMSAFADYELPPQLTVRDLMSERPRTTTPDTPLREAAREMIRGGLGALPVVDANGCLVGQLGERELVRLLLTTQRLGEGGNRYVPPGTAGEKLVRDAMTRQVLCVAPEQPIAEVAALMTNKDVERVPVVREGRLVGFLTRGDIVRKLLGY